eukprot:m.17516 g.17516  ORF g.17516 m.17516 type:complete len:124 (-) comp5477_c0_seq1:91-462(-)
MGKTRQVAPIGTRGGAVRFRRLQNAEDEYDGFVDAQFVQPEPKVPTKSIMYAVFLFLFGSVMLTLGIFLFLGIISNPHPDRWLSLVIVGSLTFIPGSYHTWIAYKAWRGDRGYSFNDIPDFDD